jgi:predicted  nucleic acid-binding Zn-ribbon protein
MDGAGELLAALDKLKEELTQTENIHKQMQDSLQQRKQANERDRDFTAKYEEVISQIETAKRESSKRIEEVRIRCANRRVLCAKKHDEKDELDRQLQALRRRLLELQQERTAEQLSQLKRKRIHELNEQDKYEQYKLVGMASTCVFIVILLYIIISL